MLQNEYFIEKVDANTAENESNVDEMLANSFLFLFANIPVYPQLVAGISWPEARRARRPVDWHGQKRKIFRPCLHA